MTNDSGEDFSQLMPDVTPLKTESKVATYKNKTNPLAAAQRRDAAVEEKASDLGLATDHAIMLTGLDELSYLKPGVQHGVFRKLRLGQYALEATLDLHRRTIEESRREILSFINDAYEMGLRCLLINHGKAMHGKDKFAKVKSYVNYWLPQFDCVLAYHSAQKHHGGTGAVYVLLKKGEKQKQQARERFSKRLPE